MVSYSEFKALDLRVGTILEAEEVPGSAKLFKLKVLADKERTLLAGLKGLYSLEELKGKKVIVLINLDPRKMMGIESQGMLLAAIEETSSGEKVSLLAPDSDISDGARIE